MKLAYIDIHGHINFPDYTDREAAIQRAQDAGVGMITVGVGFTSSQEAIQLAETHENMWAVVGIHPTDTTAEAADAEFADIRELAKHQKVVAIGECGLDYFHSKPEDITRQRELFIKHIELASQIGKPLMLHVRNGKSGEHNAYQEAIAMLREHSKVPANFHFFAGTVQDARDIVAMGNTASFTGVLTFACNYDEVVRTIPLTHIMSETDCPYVAPIPYRGQRCEPVHVIETVKKIAELRGESIEAVSAQLLKNAQKFFGI